MRIKPYPMFTQVGQDIICDFNYFLFELAKFDMFIHWHNQGALLQVLKGKISYKSAQNRLILVVLAYL